MDRMIEVRINGHLLTKDNNVAGVQYESNATSLRISFDESWDGYAKKVTFWNALGENPVHRTLTVDLLENAAVSTRVYIVPIPGEAMTEAGNCTFIIDGYIDGISRRSLSDELKVKPAPNGADAVDPEYPTPSQAEQFQLQYEEIMGTIHESAVNAASAAESAQIASAAQVVVEANAKAAAESAEAAKLAVDSAKEIAGGDFVTPAELEDHTKNTSNPHGVTAAQTGAVAKTGDTMSGRLRIDSTSPSVQLRDTGNDTTATFSHSGHVTDIAGYDVYGSSDNGRLLRLRDATNKADLTQALQLMTKVNGVLSTYNLFGEHHLPTADEVSAIGTLATYYPASTAMSADDVLDSFALIPIGPNYNAVLYEIMDGSFAYLITMFYISKTVTSRRVQIALSYNAIPQKMAVRSYGANGWIDWREVSLDAPAITFGTTELTEGVSALADGAIHFVYE